MSDHDKLREAIKHFRAQWRDNREHEMARLVLSAASSTLPKTKMVEVWHVEWSDGNIPHIDDPYLSKDMAERGAHLRRNEGRGQCIRVTGPHLQEVPSP